MQFHRRKLAVENLAGSVRLSKIEWADGRLWKITVCPNLDASKVAIHDVTAAVGRGESP